MSKQRRVSSIRLCVVLGCVVLVTSGCMNFEIREYNLQAVSLPKIPLRVGLYMSPDFRSYHIELEKLGDGMARGAEQAARQAFEEVVIIDSLSSAEIPRSAIKLIASPEIVKAEIAGWGHYDLTWGMPFTVTYKIACQWKIWSVDGKIIYQNTFTGGGTATGPTRLSTAMTLAARDQYDKFLIHVMSNKWWEAIQ